MRSKWLATLAFAGSAVFGLAVPAFAQTIGVAATVRNDVAQVRGSASSPIAQGENVVRNEVVRTGSESATKLVFRDSTNLAIGPTSTVTLDRFVFSEESAGKISVNLVRGAFRFTTGNLEKKAYEIKTPTATIGVRGSAGDILVESGRTVVTLLEPSLVVCTRSRNLVCRVLSNPGDTVVVTAAGISPVAPGGRGGFSFAGLCGGDGLCSVNRFADLSGPGAPPPGAASVASLCGR